MADVNRDREYDIKLKTPFRLLLAGPSGSGKTLWMYQFLRYHKELMTVPPAKIIIYYSVWQPIYDNLKERKLSEFVKGIPKVDDIEDLQIYKSVGGSLVIIDDHVLSVNKNLATIFSVASRHSNTSLMFMTQNLFSNNRFFRDISLQSTYIVLFKNPRDKSSIRHLAYQIMPGNTAYMLESYGHALRSAYSYLFIDLHQQTEDFIRLRTNIFPHEKPVIVYTPR